MISPTRERAGADSMSSTDPEVRAVTRDIARVRRRIAELEALARDDTEHGASPGLVHGLVAEWRARLRAMQDRRDVLLRTISDPNRQTPSPSWASTTLSVRRQAAIAATMLIERYGMQLALRVAARLAANAEHAEVARSWHRVEELLRRKVRRAERGSDM